MKPRHLLGIQAFFSLSFGVVDLLFPAVSGSWVGVRFDALGAYMARSFAAGFLGLGLVAWWARDAASSRLVRKLALACFLADVAAFLAALVAQLSGVMNALGWSLVAAWLIQAASMAYLLVHMPVTER